METKDFRRNALKMLNPSATKAGIKSILRKQRSINLVQSILGIRKAAGDLLSNFRQYALGFPMNDAERQGGIVVLGELFQHAVVAAKVTGTKVPPAQRRTKPKNTTTFLLTEIDRLANELLVPIYEVTQAKTTGTKEVTGKKKDGTPITRTVPVYGVAELNAEKIGADLSNLLHTAYEFVWSVYEYPAANIFQNRIAALTPQYPKGFFDAPAKKIGGVPGKKVEGLIEGKVPKKKGKAAAKVVVTAKAQTPPVTKENAVKA